MSARPIRPITVSFMLAIACLTVGEPRASRSDEPKKASANAWKLDEAMEQLALHPKDAYLQYVVLQLGKRENREAEAAQRVEQLTRPGGWEGGGRREGADLFSTFTGALAIQESLQLDTMRGQQPGRGNVPMPGRAAEGPPPPPLPPGVQPAQPPEPKPPMPEKKNAAMVSIDKISGPATKAHPWEKMLGDKKPDLGVLANCVPDDFWFAEFRLPAKLRDITAAGEQWGGHLFTQVLGEGRSQASVERIKKQLGLNLPPRIIDALQIEGIGLTGSDLFLSEGSDVTVLLLGRNVVAAQRTINNLMTVAGDKKEPDRFLEMSYFHQTSRDGSLNVYYANPRDDLHVRSNSLPALKRVLECVAGKTADGKPVRRLGDTAEFKYVRTLMPRGAAEEDGFVYLSDPFIRYMVGPQLKLTERRRVLVYNHLRMIGHAALLFRTEHGRAPKSIEELAAAKCAPGLFGKGELAHPDGGTYSLSEDGMSGVCSKYGRAEALAPCLEHLATEVSSDEAQEYQQWLPGYEQYWRTYFDPIAVRIQAAPTQHRMETLVLPLIDNSIYTELAAVFGGKPVELDALPTPRRKIGGVWVHFEKKPLLELLGPETTASAPKRDGKSPIQATNDLKQIGLAIYNYHDTNNLFPPAAIRNKDGNPLLSWRVALLPYLEQEALYKQFRLDEPWDSKHNKELIAKLPPVFSSGNKRLNAEGKTVYLAPVGKGTMFEPDGKQLRFPADVPDGTSNTIMLVEAAEDRAVTWTKPDDLPFDPDKPLAGLQRPGQTYFLILTADGATKRLSTKIDPQMLTWAFLRNDGHPVNLDARSDRSPRNEPPKNVVNDLKQIALAMHNYASANVYLPTAAIYDGNKKPLLSWRVAILPYIEQDQLYREFKLDEPWDSEHNKKLVARMPRIYQGPNAKLNEEGKTAYLVPVGKKGKYEPIFSADGTKRSLEQITSQDGTSNTILAVVADDEHAAIWTKPDDIAFDPEQPLAGLAKHQGLFYAAMGDGAVKTFPAMMEPAKAAALFGWRDGEATDPGRPAQAPPEPGGPGRLFGNLLPSDQRAFDELESLGFDLNKLRRFLKDGIGDQIGFAMHDGSKLLDFESAGLFGGPNLLGGGIVGGVAIGPLVQFITGPSTISIPVKNPAVVDAFLDEIDKLLLSRKILGESGIVWGRDVDFYKLPSAKPDSVRCLSISIAGLKLRLFWGRVGDGLYIANRPFLLDDIAAAQTDRAAPGRKTEPAHALLRLRPENWREVMSGYNLGWEESNRKACHDSLDMIGNVARGWNDRPAGGAPDRSVLERAAHVYGVRPGCPDSGQYTLSADGKQCQCSIHGDARHPRQPPAPGPASATAKAIKSLAGVSATLTLQPEGLRAVVILERKE